MDSIINRLDLLIQDRFENPKENSYTSKLFRKGENTIIKKIGEEFAELIKAITQNDKKEIIYESADVIYHIMVGLRYNDVSMEDVLKELEKRFDS